MIALARRSLCFMLAGMLTAIPAGLYLDLVVANVAGGKWTLVHWMLISTGGVGGLWLWEELAADWRTYDG
jgi:hypothetical protein